jgi:hypothetical protein
MHTKAQIKDAYQANAATNPLADTTDLLEMTAAEFHCSAEDVAEAVESEGVVV